MSEILVRLGPVPFFSFGLTLAAGFLLGAAVAIREGRRRGIPPERTGDFLVLSLVVGLLGARLVFVLLNRQYYRTFPWEVLLLQDGGLTFYGGLPAVIALAWTWQRGSGLFYRLLDALAPAAALAGAVALVGSDLFGRATGLPWGVTIPGGAPVHPLQAYWLAGLYALFVLLWRRRRSDRFDGEQFLYWLLGDGALRFGLGFLREGSRFWGLGYDQWAALLVLGIGWLWLRARSSAFDLQEEPGVRYAKGAGQEILEAAWWSLGLVVLVAGFYLRMGGS
ncbi:prolipoprotein diacylglyceryl transferase [Limnochorda pilosa]|uniref:Prolipoprotein diacylglyceryl transferase n=1 Tax=Limnochorda pilosa TaxID=1555112 RepID=A0A0K2SNE9_LIMPI|nr:prolipoprotein diacylglyceryl transferase family protein [Limnochorda pilosa]BAS28636.1 prolipoprotein diacylglyceryl transferase [Limnochorda pilosa]